MKTTIRKFIIGSSSCFAILALLSACESYRSYRHDEVSDCSSVFETRYVDAKGNVVSKEKAERRSKKEFAKNDAEANKPATTCKILEIKVDNNTKCEIVGSDKIDNLSKSMNENKGNRIILVIPQEKLKDLKELAEHYMMSSSIDVSKYIDSDLVKNLDFPYKGMRCVSSGKEFVLWSGDKRIILTLNM